MRKCNITMNKIVEPDRCLNTRKYNNLNAHPIAVYQKKGKYTIIDGQYRYWCIRKLRQKTIPALIIHKKNMEVNMTNMAVKGDRIFEQVGDVIGYLKKDGDLVISKEERLFEALYGGLVYIEVVEDIKISWDHGKVISTLKDDIIIVEVV